MRRSGHAEREAWKPHDLGLQVSRSVDHEISFPCAGRRRRAEGSEVAAGDSAGSRDDDLCGVDQSRPRAHAHWNTAAFVSVARSPVPQREEFAQASIGISIASELILGPASLGARVLGGDERQRH
jgi:hypothetical protein